MNKMSNLFQYFSRSYQKYPTKHYVFDGKYWTYGEVNHYIKLMITKLISENITSGDHVLLYMENSIEYIIAYFAILYMGAIVVPSTVSTTLENLEIIIDDCKPSLILTSRLLISRFAKSSIMKKARIMTVDLNAINNLVYSDIDLIDTQQLAMIIYTSGTTSKSKGVMLSHGNLVANTESILDYLPLTSKDSVLVTLPFSYSYGNSLLLTHTKVGGLLYLNQGITFPQVILSILEKENITGFSTVGSYFKLLLKQNNFTATSFKKLEYITFAGEQIAPDDLITLQNINKNLKVYVMYGQTEAGARLTYLEPSMLINKLGSIGRPIKNVVINIVDENGIEVPSGISGEIIAKGDNIMQGYLNNPQETQEVLKNGWLYTGDIGYKDFDGYIYLVSRKKDIIKHLGHRIAPIEIENYINSCENVFESAVIDYCDKQANVEIIAYIVLRDKKFSMENIAKNLRPRLPLYKIPSVYRIVDELPKTTNGKIKRAELRKIYEMTKQ
jgi:long-chain acyl-CoA synthetase